MVAVLGVVVDTFSLTQNQNSFPNIPGHAL